MRSLRLGGKRGVIVALVLVLGAAAVIAGATMLKPAAPAPPGGNNPNQPPVQAGAKEFTVNVTEQGFNGDANLSLTVKKGDNVRIRFVHQEPFNDYHPIFLSGYGQTVTVTAGGEAVMEFTADTAGTFGFFCLNGDCHIHNVLQGGKLVVVE